MFFIGDKAWDFSERKYVMGILNVTPDSFSDGGSYADVEAAVAACERMCEDGADIIDIGGQSTRPNYVEVGVEEELRRVIPVIREVKKRLDVPISIDTYQYEVAREAIAEGADLLNDIHGLKGDERLAGLVADTGASVCIMHNRDSIYEGEYSAFTDLVIRELQESVDIALSAGIDREKILIDPGIGFAKTYEQNLLLLNNLDRLNELGYPVLLAASRKSVIGMALDLPVDEREEGTIATSVIAVMKDCAMVRVHDVRANVRAVRMTEKVLGEH